MTSRMKRYTTAGILATALAVPSFAHIEKTEPLQSLRQSYFALVGMTFSPMADMVKGKMPWDADLIASWAADLQAVSTYRVERGFAPGSEQGRTRAKPEIWDDMDDFKDKLANFRKEAAALAEVAATGDEAAIKQQFKATGGTCKACHDEYKSKDYLY